MFRLFNNKITAYFRADSLKSIQHETAIIVLIEVKHFKLIMNSLNVVME